MFASKISTLLIAFAFVVEVLAFVPSAIPNKVKRTTKTFIHEHKPVVVPNTANTSKYLDVNINSGTNHNECTTQVSRKQAISRSANIIAGLLAIDTLPIQAQAKCTDIESCREEGERKIEADLKNNPIIKLSSGVRYRVLQPPTSGPKVQEGSSIDLIYSISTASGQYMYSKGFGYEKVEFGNKLQSDLGLDSLRVTIGKHQIPVGIEKAMLGMGRGERRRVELPPGVGFETSNWRPEPTTRRGKTQIEQYKKKLAGFGSQPPFPAETVWDVEVLGIRN